MTYKIQFSNHPEEFGITLLDQEFVIRSCWNDQSHNWEIDIFDQSMQPVVTSIPLICGVNLLKQHQHILPTILFCYTDGNENSIPTFDNLGTEANVYFAVVV